MTHIRYVTVEVPVPSGGLSWQVLADALRPHCGAGDLPLTLAIVACSPAGAVVELSVLGDVRHTSPWEPLWSLRARGRRRSDRFVVVHVVPTGIRAAIGGFSGDAVPVTNAMASVSDLLLTHPNVVIASDLFCASPKVACVEGNLLSRFLLGQLRLLPSRVRRLGVLIDKPKSEVYLQNVINAVNAMRAVGGLAIDAVTVSERPLCATTSYSAAGRAIGHINNFDHLLSLSSALSQRVDAVAITSEIDVAPDVRRDYYAGVAMPNPWGGVESLITHAATTLSPVPAAHAPMLASWDNVRVDGQVDPRDAAETISTTYLCSVIRALFASPTPLRVDDPGPVPSSAIILDDVAAIVLPSGAMGGIPALAAVAHGIPIIAVRENVTISPVSIHDLLGDDARSKAEIYEVDNYLEAIGVLVALRERLSCDALRRPLPSVQPRRG